MAQNPAGRTPMPKHDSSYKLLFSHRRMVADLLCGFVREEWAVRLLTYIGLLYEDLHRAKAIGPDDPLPPVFPIVLYNGAAPWTAKTDLADLMDPRLPP